MKKLLWFLLLIIPFNVLAKEEAIIDITTLSITEIQESVDKGYISYEQIVGIYLDRIDKYNDKYNAIITVNENALEEAKRLDEEYKKSGKRSLLHGLPIIVKDNIDVKGMPTTNGTKALLDSYPINNAPVIQKLVDAGAVIIAKTNMDEFAFNSYYSRSSFGYVYNAYNTNYSSYGSSGGSAVGVAASLAVASLGTDTGSSIRVPSAANGVIGLRPTYGLLSTDGIIKFESLRDVVGPITKYVEDNAIMLEIMNGDANYRENLDKSLKGVRIGVLNSVINHSSQFIKDMMYEQIENLEELGAEIVNLDSFYANYEFDATNMCYEFNEYIKGTTSKIRSFDDLINDGRYIQYIDGYGGYYCYNDYKETTDYKNYLSNRENNIKIANKKFEYNDLDVVIYPSLYYQTLSMDEIYTDVLQTFSSNVAPLVGFPSMSVPIGYYDNLPYGMEIMAQANKENIIYQIAYNLEQVNNYYKLPDIAPNLYEINNNLTTLLNYYNEDKNENEYIEAKNKIKDFFTHYSDYENKDDKINELVEMYESVPLTIEENELKKENNNKIIMFIILVFVIIIIVKLLSKKGEKNEKTKRVNRNKPRHNGKRNKK